MRILALTKYGPLGASSRLRTLQYLPVLRAAGLTIDVRELLDDRYVQDMYAGRISAVHVAKRYVKRFRDLLRASRYDLIWVEKEILPWVPSLIELAILPKAPRLVVDYDDALFHRYDQSRSWAVRRLLGSKIDGVMHRADLVLAGNDYLAARARAAGSRHVEWLPTVVDLARYKFAPDSFAGRSGPVRIGWIGSPSTAEYLQPYIPIFNELATSDDVQFIAIGARPEQVEGTPFMAVDWVESDEANLLSTLDIGIMPLSDAPWERGKCGYKLIQYMACGLPVVASPVGVNNSIVTHGKNGFLASTETEWKQALSCLLNDATLRRTMGQHGRNTVQQTYTLQRQAPRLQALLRRLVTGQDYD